MSVNRYIKSKEGTPEELELIASKGQRVFVGTKDAVQSAITRGDIGNASVVYITDDFDDTAYPERVANKAVMVKPDGAKELLTVDNLTDGSVSAIADNTVTTGKINVKAVTKEKLADNSVQFVAQAIFDMEHPVGKKGRVIQWPWEDEPKVKYNNNLIKSDWKIVTEYDGKFFKIDSKKNVGIFTPESLPNIKGDTGYHHNGDIENERPTGAFWTSTKKRSCLSYYTSISDRKTVVFDASKNYNLDGTYKSTVYKDGAKVQPDNISIKVWERTK